GKYEEHADIILRKFAKPAQLTELRFRQLKRLLTTGTDPHEIEHKLIIMQHTDEASKNEISTWMNENRQSNNILLVCSYDEEKSKNRWWIVGRQGFNSNIGKAIELTEGRTVSGLVTRLQQINNPLQPTREDYYEVLELCTDYLVQNPAILAETFGFVGFIAGKLVTTKDDEAKLYKVFSEYQKNNSWNANAERIIEEWGSNEHKEKYRVQCLFETLREAQNNHDPYLFNKLIYKFDNEYHIKDRGELLET
ncbi:unnamed protein product, partial [marine sediment metagenome]